MPESRVDGLAPSREVAVRARRFAGRRANASSPSPRRTCDACACDDGGCRPHGPFSSRPLVVRSSSESLWSALCRCRHRRSVSVLLTTTRPRPRPLADADGRRGRSLGRHRCLPIMSRRLSHRHRHLNRDTTAGPVRELTVATTNSGMYAAGSGDWAAAGGLRISPDSARRPRSLAVPPRRRLVDTSAGLGDGLYEEGSGPPHPRTPPRWGASSSLSCSPAFLSRLVSSDRSGYGHLRHEFSSSPRRVYRRGQREGFRLWSRELSELLWSRSELTRETLGPG